MVISALSKNPTKRQFILTTHMHQEVHTYAIKSIILHYNRNTTHLCRTLVAALYTIVAFWFFLAAR